MEGKVISVWISYKIFLALCCGGLDEQVSFSGFQNLHLVNRQATNKGDKSSDTVGWKFPNQKSGCCQKKDQDKKIGNGKFEVVDQIPI